MSQASLPTIRTITLGIAEPHPLSSSVLASALKSAQEAMVRYTQAGYTVQTTRLSTRPLFADLNDWSSERILAYVQQLQQVLNDLGIEFCSLGTVFASAPDFPLARLDLVADLLIASNVSMTVQMASKQHGLRSEAAYSIAHIMQRLAAETEEGFGNFRFAMLACVEPGTPFFPAAYHTGPSSISLGLQGVSIIHDALRQIEDDRRQPCSPTRITDAVRNTVLAQAEPIVALARQIAREQNIQFGGIDLSPAPMGEESIVAAMEHCGYGPLGSPGTLTVAAALTEGLKSCPLPICGYTGLMLPVLEDAVLGKRWDEGRVNAHQLLFYSAVCGTGLDTIPLPGDSTVENIAALLLDVAVLSVRYQKPLSARLFPVMGRQAGERTTFTSPFLTNTRITSIS